MSYIIVRTIQNDYDDDDDGGGGSGGGFGDDTDLTVEMLRVAQQTVLAADQLPTEAARFCTVGLPGPLSSGQCWSEALGLASPQSLPADLQHTEERVRSYVRFSVLHLSSGLYKFHVDKCAIMRQISPRHATSSAGTIADPSPLPPCHFLMTADSCLKPDNPLCVSEMVQEHPSENWFQTVN